MKKRTVVIAVAGCTVVGVSVIVGVGVLNRPTAPPVVGDQLTQMNYLRVSTNGEEEVWQSKITGMPEVIVKNGQVSGARAKGIYCEAPPELHQMPPGMVLAMGALERHKSELSPNQSQEFFLTDNSGTVLRITCRR